MYGGQWQAGAAAGQPGPAAVVLVNGGKKGLAACHPHRCLPPVTLTHSLQHHEKKEAPGGGAGARAGKLGELGRNLPLEAGAAHITSACGRAR